MDALISIDKVHQPKCVWVARVDNNHFSLHTAHSKSYWWEKIFSCVKLKRRKFWTDKINFLWVREDKFYVYRDECEWMYLVEVAALKCITLSSRFGDLFPRFFWKYIFDIKFVRMWIKLVNHILSRTTENDHSGWSTGVKDNPFDGV